MALSSASMGFPPKDHIVTGMGSPAQQEVQDVPAGGGIRPVELGVAAALAADGDKLLVLHIKDLGKITAGGLKLIGGIGVVATLGTLIHLLFHRTASFPVFHIHLHQDQNQEVHHVHLLWQ